MTASSRTWTSVASTVSGACVAAWCGLWLTETLSEGYAQSFDALIHARSLWGLAFGDFYNPVLDRPTLTIHANLVLFALAPPARVFHPVEVLAWAQAIALGATAALFGWSLGDAWLRWRPHQASHAPWVALWGVLLAMPASALVTNPFFFDLHPDVLGVPFLTAGLLRAVRQGRIDLRALLWMLPSVLSREDYALLIASALWFTPAAKPLAWRWRWMAAALGGGWFVGVWTIALWVGGAMFGLKSHLGATQTFAWGSFAQGKLWLLAGLLTSAGALHLRGWRWLGAGLPGFLLLLANQNMIEAQLRFHYSALVAPGVLAAALAGWEATLKAPAPTRWADWRAAMVASSLVAVLGFLVFSAAPGGGWAWGPSTQEQAQEARERGAQVRALLRPIPQQDGVIAPFWCAAPLSNRPWITLPSEVSKRLERGEGVPERLDTAALERRDWAGLGALLVRQHGFRVLGQRGGLALLTRSPRLEGAGLAWEEVPNEAGAPSCASGLGAWPQAGLRFGGLRALPDGRVAALVARDAPSGNAAPLALVAVGADPQSPPEELTLMGGMLGPQDLPVGACAAFVTRAPMGHRVAGVALLNPATDGALVARSPTGQDVPVLSAPP